MIASQITDEEAIDLLRESARRFALAGVPWAKARIGILGFWVGEREISELNTEILSGHQLPNPALLRAAQARFFWRERGYAENQNPYEPLVRFLESGGTLSRWEHHVLDVSCPSGAKYGVPEHTFVKANT